MPTNSGKRKNVRCAKCNYVLKKVPTGNGWAHKNKKHWVDQPHKAVPEVLEVFADDDAAA